MKPGAIVNRKMTDLADWIETQQIDQIEPLTVAAGMLERLWIAVAQQADDGDLTGWSDRQIARCTGWRGDPSELVTVLDSAGWLDGEEGSRRIHDWEEHAPGYVRDKMRKRAERGGQSGNVQERPGHSRKCTEKVRPSLRTASLRTASSEVDPTDPPPDSAEPEPGDEPAESPKPKRTRKPLTEQAGLVADLARLWRDAGLGDCPEWTAAHAKALNAKRWPADEVRLRFGRYLSDPDEFHAPAHKPLGKLVQHWDRYGSSWGQATIGAIEPVPSVRICVDP